MSAFKDENPRLLLAEGKNDCYVMASLFKQHKVEKNFGIYDCGSDHNALKRLSAMLAGAIEYKVIGIVIDADNPDIKSKWSAIKDRLNKAGYTVPNTPISGGTILDYNNGMPKIGIWLMPDNNIDGMLEDFCSQLAGTEAIDFARACVLQAKDKGYSTYKDVHLSKATIHTFLAWQDEPGMPLGQAVTSKALDGAQPLAQEFIQFITELFS